MATAMVDFDSNFNSGFDPAVYVGIPDPWLTDVREPHVAFGFGCMQDAVGAAANYLGGNTGMGLGWGYLPPVGGPVHSGVMYGYGDFVGILADDYFAYCALSGLPYYRSGAGAPPLENCSLVWPVGCGKIQSQYVYPRNALTGCIAVGGPDAIHGNFVLPNFTSITGSGTVTGLPFQPNLLFLHWVWGGNFDGNHSLGWGACGSDLTQFSCAIQGGSWRSFDIRSHAFHSNYILNLYYENVLTARITIDAINADGFDYSWERFGGIYDAYPWTFHWQAYDFPTDEIQVGMGTFGDDSITTPWEPEGIVYWSANCPEGWSNPHGNFAIGSSAGGGIRAQGGNPAMQRVASAGHGGRQYDEGVIRFTSYTPFDPGGLGFATHTITATGADLSWTGGSNSKRFGYFAWGRSSLGRPNCKSLAQIYRLVRY